MLVNCIKCDGKGKLEAFGHIANGDCFACKGAGQVKAGTKHAPREIGGRELVRLEWMRDATAEQWAAMSDRQIVAAHKFAHAPQADRKAAGFPWEIIWPDTAQDRFNQYQDTQRAKLGKFAL